MNLEIVTIGDELLLGFTIDTNAAQLARELAALGVRIVRRTTCGDDAESIRQAVSDALGRTGAVITTGGLGPTADDMTKPAIAAIFGKGMRLDTGILTALRERWRKRFGHDLPVSNEQQAMVPEGCTILPNRHGSAPGIWLEDAQGRWVIMLPGVPREMRGMLADTVVPTLRDRLPVGGPVIRSRTLRTANIAESALADRLGELARGVNGLSLAYLPGADGVDLRLTSWDRDARATTVALDEAAALVRSKVSRYVYGENDDDLAAIMLAECAARNATVAVAESCTGGMLGMRLTAVPGSSRTVLGGTIAYANAVKTRELGVSAALIDEQGAVSEPVARAMATGVRLRFGSTIGLGITGIAGPDGGTPEKPVGTVWVAVDLDGDVHAVRAVLPGDRHEIRWRAAQLALDRLRKAFLREQQSEGWTARG
ncbi:MAG: competence/damage-inducible protein A [Gemmatimonas sp.]|jgi:nicotinamide-nucleotide amidase|uniref:competence/damage-inducible protein A n=2 Tax=Gemmatimonas sp. TaxID=1962908 RepID=UPI0025BF0977|nr:competence/damage-inducible protein A [Gemmatimonas sp.]MCA2994820.1 competence/damage-inducible protein A [Gemmatimonas sp.]MCE2955180.1 competence/damage-inducible protein A [Gemmatimonas sp.]